MYAHENALKDFFTANTYYPLTLSNLPVRSLPVHILPIQTSGTQFEPEIQVVCRMGHKATSVAVPSRTHKIAFACVFHDTQHYFAPRVTISAGIVSSQKAAQEQSNVFYQSCVNKSVLRIQKAWK